MFVQAKTFHRGGKSVLLRLLLEDGFELDDKAEFSPEEIEELAYSRVYAFGAGFVKSGSKGFLSEALTTAAKYLGGTWPREAECKPGNGMRIV